ncbi:MAG: M48 family metallopeptidase [Muribaculaceae bacterium]
MSLIHIIEDDELGRISVYTHSNSRKVSIRKSPDKYFSLKAVIPSEKHLDYLKEIIKRERKSLKALCQEISKERVDETFAIDSDLFKLRMKLDTYNGREHIWRNNDGTYLLYYNEETNFDDEFTQMGMEDLVVWAMRQQASHVLPKIIMELANAMGAKVTNIKISKARSRWGSCSSTGTISLSCFLVTLPVDLIKFVIIHELSHTFEMNHSSRFHELVDKLTGGREKDFEERLNQYHTNIYSASNIHSSDK